MRMCIRGRRARSAFTQLLVPYCVIGPWQLIPELQPEGAKDQRIDRAETNRADPFVVGHSGCWQVDLWSMVRTNSRIRSP